MTTMVFSYGCKHPREGADLIDSQIWNAHRYYNRLVELHRQQMERTEELRRERFPEFAAAEKAVQEADEAVDRQIEAIRKQNAKAHGARARAEESATRKAAQSAAKIFQVMVPAHGLKRVRRVKANLIKPKVTV